VAAWTCNWVTTLLPDGVYTVTATITDAAGNIGTVTRIVNVDNNPPITAFNSYNEVTNGQYMVSSGSTMYFNPTYSGTFDLKIAASDAGTGISSVQFPDVDGAGSNWGPAGGSNSAGPNPYVFTYSWVAGATSPGLQVATAFDNAGNSANAQFSLVADNSPPTGGSLSYFNGFLAGSSTSITFAPGTDPGAGLQDYQLQHRTAGLVSGSCGAYSAWSNIGAVNTDESVLRGWPD